MLIIHSSKLDGIERRLVKCAKVPNRIYGIQDLAFRDTGF